MRGGWGLRRLILLPALASRRRGALALRSSTRACSGRSRSSSMPLCLSGSPDSGDTNRARLVQAHVKAHAKAHVIHYVKHITQKQKQEKHQNIKNINRQTYNNKKKYNDKTKPSNISESNKSVAVNRGLPTRTSPL